MSVAATRWRWKHGKQKQHLFSTLWKTGDGKRVPYKYVHPFLDTGAHIYRGPVFHHLFTTLAPVFCFETVYTHTQTSGNVLSKSGVRLALAAPV
jgi:hypothetical protein